MSSELNKRLYDFEVTPPPAVWEKLAADLDEINADNRLAQKIYAAESIPAVSAWKNIDGSLSKPVENLSLKKGLVIPFKKFALAAILTGIIISGWLIIRNLNSGDETLAETDPVIKTSVPVTKTEAAKENSNDNAESSQPLLVEIKKNSQQTSSAKKINKPGPEKTKHFNEPAYAAQTRESDPINETTGSKTFNQPIDDLGMIADGTNYMTMVNTNGRLVKIPANLTHLAPHLQDKPLSEDYYEIMFGEGNYWKETFDDWRKKLASAAVTTGDNFTSFIEMLKTVREN